MKKPWARWVCWLMFGIFIGSIICDMSHLGIKLNGIFNCKEAAH
jgi:hypothetical protein